MPPKSPALQAILTGAAVAGLIIAYAVAEYVRQSGALDEWRETWRESVQARFAAYDAGNRIDEENAAEAYVPDEVE